jgi:hypothetical protein
MNRIFYGLILSWGISLCTVWQVSAQLTGKAQTNTPSVNNKPINRLFDLQASFTNEIYQPLKCKGKMPADFTALATTQYKQNAASIGSHDQKRIRKAKDLFYLESSFHINQLLLSGSVLFNDTVSVYLNKILDQVLAGNKPLRDSIRIYTLRSNVVNALTTQNGIILVTTGLIAHAENEAELAYILSHEVIHYKNHHSIQAVVEQVKRDRTKGSYASMNDDDRQIARYSFDRLQESEAVCKG